jgi:4-aminobutyrate aminotransferase/diaminobutyrate-pyruvate transaminase/4-aminobutyrate aminotransferase/(S)-3-amino-2-methylpropionate transaminase
VTGEVTYSPFEPKSMHAAFDVEWFQTDGYKIDNKYIDFSSGIYCCNVGHNNYEVNNAINEQIWHSLTHSWQFPTEIRSKFLEKLVSFFPSYLNRVVLTCEGSMANEKAIWLAEEFTGIKGCGSNPLAFHGNTFMLRNMYRDSQQYPMTGAIIFEPYVGFAAQFHGDNYIQFLKTWQEKGVVLICDEIQSGFGRTGKMFGFQWYKGLKPDLVTFGKGVANGMPLAGVIGRKDIMECLDGRSYVCNTHSGNPVCCAAALGTLEELEKLDLSTVRKNGKAIEKRISGFVDDYGCVLGTGGRGYVHAVLFDSESSAKSVSLDCLTRGLMITNNISKKSIKITPPLITPLDVVMSGIDIIEEALKDENKRN